MLERDIVRTPANLPYGIARKRFTISRGNASRRFLDIRLARA
jgi:hypothetical protein